MFKKILVPTDGSVMSEKAIAGAIDYAKATGASLIVITANELLLPVIYGDAWSAAIPIPVDDSIVEEIRKMAAENLDAIGRRLDAAGISHETVLVDNEPPWEAILDQAERHGCDAIFMGSHGRRGFDALLLGSETHKVLTHTKLPVLVFR